MRDFFAQLDTFSRGRQVRRLLSAPSGSALIREVPLWSLTLETTELLKSALPMGFVSTEYDEDLWLEDLAVYRGGEFMMGVLSHEDGGVLRITEAELQELRAVGFPDRDQVPWVGY